MAITRRVVEISKLCQELGVGHIINNAYGLQASKITHLVEQACRYAHTPPRCSIRPLVSSRDVVAQRWPSRLLHSKHRQELYGASRW